jgi:fumarylacetoacetate (FAA) hydrolase
MKLATLPDSGRDGALVVVSRDGSRAVSASAVAATLQDALDRWSEVEAPLRALADEVERGGGAGAFDAAAALAPLPRAWQWLDGSAFPSHGALMQTAFKLPPHENDRPLMYQGMSHQFLSPIEDVPLPDEADGIDFEGEFGVIVDATPMGVSPAEALGHIKLIVQINDWSLRTLAPIEMKTGFGWIHAKPACSMAPLAITPDELGGAWRDGRVHLPLRVWWNGELFGEPNGEAMAYGFHELVAHAARTRELCAGTIVGSGTVSNPDYRKVGSTCIAERRGIEMIDTGAPQTAFMRFGDEVRMEAGDEPGQSPFGAIRQRVVRYERR